MTASRSARERKAASEAGPLARVKMDVDTENAFTYKVSCTECVGKGDRPWSTYRRGEGNGYLAAMDRWIFHLTEKHPESEAPCLAFLAEAQQRLQQRRDELQG